jgi:hypothetical protein
MPQPTFEARFCQHWQLLDPMALRFLHPKPSSRAAWDDDEFVQPTFQVAVEKGNPLG